MPPTRARIRARPGFTFLETVAAAALLGILAAAVFGALNALVSSQSRMRQRLACAELANRIVLMYLDDKDSMPPRGGSIPYAGSEYRWEMTERPVEIVPARPDVAAERAAENRGLRLDRIQNVTVRVWLDDGTGETAMFTETGPFAVVNRMVDPIGRAMRNPDSAEYLLRDPNSPRFQEFMSDLQRFSNSGRGAVRPTPSPPPGSVK
jgi:prepilin-type N-terminal cleavage/methylation domain-containing protein